MPALSIVTGAVPRFSEIVKPGPTVPVSFGGAIGVRRPSAATSAAAAAESSVQMSFMPGSTAARGRKRISA